MLSFVSVSHCLPPCHQKQGSFDMHILFSSVGLQTRQAQSDAPIPQSPTQGPSNPEALRPTCHSNPHWIPRPVNRSARRGRRRGERVLYWSHNEVVWAEYVKQTGKQWPHYPTPPIALSRSYPQRRGEGQKSIALLIDSVRGTASVTEQRDRPLDLCRPSSPWCGGEGLEGHMHIITTTPGAQAADGSPA